MENQKTQRLTVSGIMIALGTILSLIKLYAFPTGGSITLCSMLPVMLVAYTYGVKWGIYTGAVYGILQGILGATMSSAFAGQGIGNIVLICWLDYIIAYAVMGFAGLFRKKIKNAPLGFILGIIIAGLLRLASHIASGYILYGSYAEWFFTEQVSWGNFFLESFSGKMLALVYSIVYNSIYMLPEILITAIAGGIIIAVPAIRNNLKKD